MDFLAFAKVMHQLPDLDGILETGRGSYPDEVDVLYALSAGLVSKLLADPSAGKIDNLLRYTLELQSEFAVMIVQDLKRAGVVMDHSDAFGDWVNRFAYLLA